MSEVAVNDTASATEASEKLTWGARADMRRQAALKLVKAGSRDALAMVLVTYLPGVLRLNLSAAEYRQNLDAVVAEAVDGAKRWEKVFRLDRAVRRIHRTEEQIADGTYRPPRKRRKARKRKVSK